MNDKLFYKIIIILLVAINLGTLGFIWMGRHRPGPPDGRLPGDVVAFLTKELQLTAGQQDTLKTLQETFKDEIRDAEENYRGLHPPFFDQLQGAAIDSAKFNLALDALTAGSRKIETLTFGYFRQVRAMCNPQQQLKFDGIVNEAMRMLAPQQPHMGQQPPPPVGPPPGNGNMPPPPQQGPPPPDR
jgi:hypothetical protein